MVKVDPGLLIPKFGNSLCKLWQATGKRSCKGKLSLFKLLSKNIVFVSCRQCLMNEELDTKAQERFF